MGSEGQNALAIEGNRRKQSGKGNRAGNLLSTSVSNIILLVETMKS
jgi:hypothetical protein